MSDCCDTCSTSPAGSGSNDLYAVTPYASAESLSGQVASNTPPLVTLEEAKQHCRVDISDDDALVQSYLDAALDYVASRVGVSLTLTQHTVRYTSFPDNGKPLVPPFPNFASPSTIILPDTNITYKDTGGTSRVLTLGTGFGTLTSVNPTPFVPTGNGGQWPTDYAYSAEAGYVTLNYYTAPSGAYFKASPQLKVAVLMLTAHWYTAREPVTTGLNASNNKVPYTIDILLSQNTEITF